MWVCGFRVRLGYVSVMKIFENPKVNGESLGKTDIKNVNRTVLFNFPWLYPMPTVLWLKEVMYDNG